MTNVFALWLPILVSAVAVFLLSSVIHMFLTWHKHDYPMLPNEDKVLAALRPFAIPPGDYMAPRPSSSKEMRSPEFLEKRKQGPVLVMTVISSGPVTMGASLALWFVYLLVVCLFAAYIACRSLPAGAEFKRVACLIGVTAFMGYALALWQMSIWYKRAWGTTIRATVDGVIYALVTAGIFGWLWPR